MAGQSSIESRFISCDSPLKMNTRGDYRSSDISVVKRDGPLAAGQTRCAELGVPLGDLTGIKNINPPRHLEIVPYVMGRTRFDDDTDLWGNIGTDMRFGITSGITLDATVNPILDRWKPIQRRSIFPLMRNIFPNAVRFC